MCRSVDSTTSTTSSFSNPLSSPTAELPAGCPFLQAYGMDSGHQEKKISWISWNIKPGATTVGRKSNTVKAFLDTCRGGEHGEEVPWHMQGRGKWHYALRATRRYSPLCRLSSSSCGGLWHLAEVCFAIRGKKRVFFGAVYAFFGCSVITSVTFSSPHRNFGGKKSPKKSKNPKNLKNFNNKKNNNKKKSSLPPEIHKKLKNQ